MPGAYCRSSARCGLRFMHAILTETRKQRRYARASRSAVRAPDIVRCIPTTYALQLRYAAGAAAGRYERHAVAGHRRAAETGAAAGGRLRGADSEERPWSHAGLSRRRASRHCRRPGQCGHRPGADGKLHVRRAAARFGPHDIDPRPGLVNFSLRRMHPGLTL